MNHERQNEADPALDVLLRAARPVPTLPPGFAQGVWRRVEQAELEAKGGAFGDWLDRFADLLIRPRIAAAGVAGLLLLCTVAGVVSGAQTARRDAWTRYVAAVAPPLEP